MNKSHSYIQKRLLLFLDQELAENEQTEVSRHLSQCSQCQIFYNQLKSVYVSETKAQPGLPSYLWTRIQSRLQSKMRRERVQRWQQVVRPAAAVFILMFCFFVGHFLGSFQSSLIPASTSLSEEEMVYQLFGMKATEPFADYTMARAVNAVYNGQ